jgi:hypothetical protein
MNWPATAAPPSPSAPTWPGRGPARCLVEFPDANGTAAETNAAAAIKPYRVSALTVEVLSPAED